jgi:hypothetical protein
MFLGHEIGHNMGLTHTGSLVCPFTEDGVINREPTMCKPSWYGDSTSFMGSGQTLQLPAAIRYKVGFVCLHCLAVVGFESWSTQSVKGFPVFDHCLSV